MVAFIGRPILWLIKFFRWPLLVTGIFFNSVSAYSPTTGEITNEKTIIPLIAGIVLFAIGTTVIRYDELAKEAYSTYDKDF
jgi:hypothetical protein